MFTHAIEQAFSRHHHIHPRNWNTDQLWKTDQDATEVTQKNSIKKEWKRDLSIDNDPAIVFVVVLGDLLKCKSFGI